MCGMGSVSMDKEDWWAGRNSPLQGQPQAAETGAEGRELLPQAMRKGDSGTSVPSPAGQIDAFAEAKPWSPRPASRTTVIKAIGSWVESPPRQLEPKEEKLPS